MGRSRRRQSRNRSQGFSGSVQLLAWGPITRRAGIRGRRKRKFFNQVSVVMVLSVGMIGAAFGYSLLGWVGAILGFLVAAGFMNKFVIRKRFYR